MTTSPEIQTNLVLVRHGESTVMERGIVGGLKSCTGLDDLGRAQAHALLDRWHHSGEMGAATVLYASSYPRAQETAQILRPSISTVGLPVKALGELAVSEILRINSGGAPRYEITLQHEVIARESTAPPGASQRRARR